jgi:hypothetical protein
MLGLPTLAYLRIDLPCWHSKVTCHHVNSLSYKCPCHVATVVVFQRQATNGDPKIPTAPTNTSKHNMFITLYKVDPEHAHCSTCCYSNMLHTWETKETCPISIRWSTSSHVWASSSPTQTSISQKENEACGKFNTAIDQCLFYNSCFNHFLTEVIARC